MFIIPPKTEQCQLCQRTDIQLTKHHLIPKSQHSKNRTRKMFTKSQRITSIAWLCRPCHSMIHHYVSEKDMAQRYYTLDALLEFSQIVEFIVWIKNKPSAFKPKF